MFHSFQLYLNSKHFLVGGYRKKKSLKIFYSLDCSWSQLITRCSYFWFDHFFKRILPINISWVSTTNVSKQNWNKWRSVPLKNQSIYSLHQKLWQCEYSINCYSFQFVSILNLIFHHENRLEFSNRNLKQLFWTFVNLSLATILYFVWTS